MQSVRFGSEADMCGAKWLSALPPKADVCGAKGDVRFVPMADIGNIAATKRMGQVRFPYYGPRSAIKMPTTRYRPRNPPSSRHTVWKNRNDVWENPSRR